MGISALLAAQILDASATGRSVLTGADAAAIRTTLGLGTLATQSPTGTPSASTFLRGDYSWQTIDLSGYVPYTGATGSVNLGANAFTASQATLSAGTLNGTVLDIAQTWGGTGTYTGIKYNVTDSGPANAASLLLDLQVGGTSSFRVRKDGYIFLPPNKGVIGEGTLNFYSQWSPPVFAMSLGPTNAFFGDSLSLATAGIPGSADTFIRRDAANTLAQRNSTNAQTFRLYGTYTDASNYRRLFLSSTTAGAFTLGVEGAGTGASGNTLTVGPAIFKTNDNEIYGVVKNGTSGSDTSRLFIWADGRQQARFGYASGYDGLLLGNGSYGPMIWMGGATSSFPAIKRNGTALNFRLADDSADCNITAKAATFSGNVTITQGTSDTSVLTSTGYSLTGSNAQSLIDVAGTWNTTGTPTLIKANVTDTASNAASLLMDLRVGGSSRFSVDKTGAVVISDGTNALTIDSSNGATTFLQTPQILFQTSNAFVVRHGNSDPFSIRALSSGEGRLAFLSTANATQVVLTPDAAQTLAQRNSTNAQTFRIYNTFTDASNYERAKIAWESSVLRIGTEKAGTGSARALELQTDGTTRLAISSTGDITLGTASGTRLLFANAAGAPSITNYSNSGISVLGQDGAVGTLNTGNVICRNTGFVYWSGRALMTSSANGVVHVQNFDMNDSVNQVLCLGPATSSTNGVRLRRAIGTTVVDFRNGNDTDAADITAKAATFSGNLTLSTVNLVTDTTTGTKIGTATTQKIGFWNATPVVQPTAVADATDAASVITQLNALLSRMRDLGLIAT